MNEYNFNVKFEKGRISSNLKKLVQNDYNSTKINFTFDKEGRKLFKMLYPDGTAYITQIDNDELIFGPGILNQDGIYEVEIALYTEDGRLTDYATTKFDVRAELIQSDEIVEIDDRLPILDSLISDVQGTKTEIEDAIQYATEQGDYAKEQANRNFDAIEEATKIVDNFEENVNEYKENFDNNAILKTNDFNSNVDEKTTIFDNHVINGIDAFNTNATTKLNEYNNNAASKLETYNNNSNTKLEEYNTNATEKLEEYNNNADNLISNVKETRNELERIKNDVLETGEANGNYLTLNDSTMAEYQELEVEGVCEQVVTTGKNLLDFETYQTRTPVNTWIEIIKEGNPFIGAGNYSFSCIGEFGNNYILWTRSNSGNIHKVTNNSSFGVTEEQFNSITSIKLVIEGVTGGTTYKGNIYPMIRLASITDDTYEPYTGGEPSPNPDYPQEISVIENELKVVSCNKNLFDKENANILNVFIDNTNNKMGLDANCRSIFIKCKPNTNYVISKKVTPRFIVGTTSIIPNVNVICNSITRNDTATNISFKTGVNDKYLVVYFINSYVEEDFIECLNTLQIEENTQATSFEEHLETVINANLGNEFVGKINDTVKDILRASYNEDDGEYHLYLDKVVKKIIFNGAENWIKSGNSNKNFFVGALTENSFVSLLKTKNSNIVCSHFTKGDLKIKECFSFYNEDSLKIYTSFGLSLETKKVTTLEQFKQWLSANNVTIYYETVEPYTVDLGKIEMPITYDEATNLFTDSDLMPIINAKYYRNFTETVRNLQINNDTLKNELASIENRLSALETAQVSVVNESEAVE